MENFEKKTVAHPHNKIAETRVAGTPNFLLVKFTISACFCRKQIAIACHDWLVVVNVFGQFVHFNLCN